nr:MAG TPA: hypothetical protein [Caudoviricetes sp.]
MNRTRSNIISGWLGSAAPFCAPSLILATTPRRSHCQAASPSALPIRSAWNERCP